jgi:isopenicillin N synthase-like dioxygenase
MRRGKMGSDLPIVDLNLLNGEGSTHDEEVQRLAAACRDVGFFCLTEHSIAAGTLAELEVASRRFFALSESDKAEIAMSRGGLAWRGWFPVGGELTSGRSDCKEGIYFGADLPSDDPRVAAGWPLHGANVWPSRVPELRGAVTAFMSQAADTAALVMQALAECLGLDRGYFASGLTEDPTVLFRIFHYPASSSTDAGWGVGEHTDYGLLTLLAQDDCGGLQVRVGEEWVEVPPTPGLLVCNLGDMLERLTGGHFRSTPHRVLNRSGRSRLSFPFFFDPGFDATITPLPSRAVLGDDPRGRWDGDSVLAADGTYGEYLVRKVSKVFPELARSEVSRGASQLRRPS